MTINQRGLDLIKRFEGCKLQVYLDLVGLKTVGYGHRCDELPVGRVITQEEAEDLLKKDLADFEKGVCNLVKVPLNDNQFSALVCFSYNVGLSALKRSRLLIFLNQEKYEEAGEQFLKWDTAGGQIVAGLSRRRHAERDLFLSEPIA